MITSPEWALSDLAVRMCKASYIEDGDELRATVGAMGCDEISILSNPLTDAQAFCTRRKGSLWVSIRGSDSGKDWKQNFKFIRKQGSHEGFHFHAFSLWFEIQAFAKNYPDDPVVVCGHSLGGGVAALLSDWFVRSGRVVHLITFGQPRVYGPREGKRAAAGLKTYSRWVNDDDIVPHLPPAFSGLYRHSGRLLFIDSEGRLHGKSPKAGTSLRHFFMSLGFRGGRGEHHIDRYLEAIKNLEPKRNRT